MLTHQQIDTLESAYEILDMMRNSRDFNEAHDLTVSDGCQVISDFLEYCLQQRSDCNQISPVIQMTRFESFNNL